MTAELKNAMMRFLLGEMPAEERAAFEDQYIKDPDLFQQLVELENDLIDLYAMGALSRSERKRLEQSLLADPERQNRLPFARAMAGYSAQEKPTRPIQSLFGSLPWLPALLPIAAVLLLVLLVGTGWLLLANHNLRTELETLRDQQAAALKTTADLQQQVDALIRELAARDQSTHDTSSGQTLLSFALKADSLRGDGQTPRLVLPPAVSSLALHLIFSADSFSDYNVFLETANGSLVWHKTHAKGQPSAAGNKEIVVTFPTSLFKNGDYVARITAGSGSGAEDVAGYSFSIVRR